jgi:carboxymethylenebutenolidase
MAVTMAAMQQSHMTSMPAALAVILAIAAPALRASAQTGGQPAAPPPMKLPADADAATQALLDSPRHGEWIDVPLAAAEVAGAEGASATIRTWIVHPERADRAPVVIVIHEIFGLTNWVRAVADQLAAEGFIAVAPDLLSGKGPGGGGTESFPGDAVREAIRGLSADEVVRRLDAVRAWAAKLPSATAKSATVGFCWGGSSSFSYASAQPGLSAAVVYYGTAPTDRAALARIACPVLGLYGGDDGRVTSTVEGTAAAMKELGKSYTPHVYLAAGHGFLRQRKGREGANEDAAQEAWKETVRFLREHLEKKPAP